MLLREAKERYCTAYLSELRERAAAALAADGAVDDAMTLLHTARAWTQAASLIVAQAPALAPHRRAACLSRWIAPLPPGVVEREPWLLYWCAVGGTGHALGTRLSLFEQAADGFDANGDHGGFAAAWCSAVEALLEAQQDLRPLDRWLERFDARMSAGWPPQPPDLAAGIAVALFGALLARRPGHPDVDVWAARVERVVADQPRCGSARLGRLRLARLHLLRGRLSQTRLLLGPMENSAAEPPAVVALHRLCEAELAAWTGRLPQALDAIDEGLLAIARPTPADDAGQGLPAEGHGSQAAAGWRDVLRSLGAVLAIDCGDLARADRLMVGIDPFAAPGADAARHHALAAAAWRHCQGAERRPPLAMALIDEARRTAAAQRAAADIAMLEVAKAAVLLACGRAGDAAPCLAAARDANRNAGGDPAVDWACGLLAAQIALADGDVDAAVTQLAPALALGREHGLHHHPYFCRDAMAELCRHALEQGLEPAYVTRLIECNALKGNPAWVDTDAWPWPVRVHTLGGFEVTCRDQPLRFGRKAQKRPLDLLKAIIALGPKPVDESLLCDALWPDSEGDAAAQALATTLCRLRKLVGADAVLRRDGTISLAESVCWVDCWALERLLASELSSDRRMLLQALCSEPFLADDARPWAVAARRRLEIRLGRAFAGAERPRVRLLDNAERVARAA